MRTALLFLMAIAPSASLARAPDSLDAKAARTYVELGTEYFRAREYERALAEFWRAEPYGEALGDLAGIRYNIARSLEELGRSKEAVEAFDRYLELDDDPTVMARARRKRDQLYRSLYGGLLVRCAVPGLVVEVDGSDLDPRECPASWGQVEVGAYGLTLRRGGLVVGHATVEIAGGQTQKEIDAGLVVIRGDRVGAPVLVDGRQVGLTPLELLVAPGEHVIEIDRWTRRVEVRRDDLIEVNAGGVTAEASRSLPWDWILAGAGGAALLVGGGLMIAGASEAGVADERFERYKTIADSQRAKEERRRVMEGDVSATNRLNLGLGLVVVGAALGGGAAWLFTHQQPRVISTVWQDGAALGLRGRW